MKKICLFLLGVITIAACSKRAQEPSQSILASNFGVNVHNFSSDANTKVTTTTNNSYTFNWQSTDKIGVFPLTVDDRQENTQLGCTLKSSSANQATFQGSGWGLICNGNYKYASYYPYSAENRVDAIKVSFPANLAVNNGYTSHIAPYVHMYAPAIMPTDVEAANFNFYQVGALAHFEITTPAGVQYTKLVISTEDNSPVFTTEGTYNLADVTSENKPVITPTTQVNAIGMSLNVTLAPGEKLDLYFIMAPAQLEGKTLNFKLFDGNNNKYTGTKDCAKNQESGKIYKYSVALTKESVEFDPSTIEAVDLGHPLYYFAPFNLGATSIEETGDFFAWGETATKETFTKDSYTFPSNLSYYDALQDNTVQIYDNTYKVFKPEYDAATQIWGNGWMIPNYIEVNGFLQNQCDKEWVTINGTQGWKCYNKKDHDKWIFLPATGIKSGSKVTNTNRGYYWTSYITGEHPNTQHFAETCEESAPNNMGITCSRYDGLAIRPVKLK